MAHPASALRSVEQVTSLITEGLVALGIDVTLFATGDSVTAAELDSVCAVPYAENPDMDGRVWKELHRHCDQR